jgi:hypothetical protein
VHYLTTLLGANSETALRCSCLSRKTPCKKAVEREQPPSPKNVWARFPGGDLRGPSARGSVLGPARHGIDGRSFGMAIHCLKPH